MKAMILAAGKGERLRPFTDCMPKPMVSVAGKPLLEHIVLSLRDAGITDLVINLHYFPDVIRDHFSDGKRFGVKIEYSIEPDLLGTAGAVKKVSQLFTEPFIIYYGDNFVEIDLAAMITSHQASAADVTIAIFPCEQPHMSGIVRVDANQNILEFIEKPPIGSDAGNLANAGIYVLNPSVLSRIPADRPSDFGRDIFPALIQAGRPLRAFTLEGRVFGIDTPELRDRVEQYLARRSPGHTDAPPLNY